jgi:hypothetical protein
MRLMIKLKIVEQKATWSEIPKESQRAPDENISSLYQSKVKLFQGAGNLSELKEKTTMTIRGK